MVPSVKQPGYGGRGSGVGAMGMEWVEGEGGDLSFTGDRLARVK